MPLFLLDEPPVPYSPVVILGETDDIIAVNKPAALPVHPCGAYRYNSLETILRKENKLSEFYFIHRLDRVTSGVMLLAKRKDIASKLSEQLVKGGFHKVYLAEAEGNCFEKPEIPGVFYTQQNGIAVDRNIAVVSQKEGIFKVDEKEGKVGSYFVRFVPCSLHTRISSHFIIRNRVTQRLWSVCPSQEERIRSDCILSTSGIPSMMM